MPRYFYFVNDTTARFLTFRNDAIQMRYIEATLGKIKVKDVQQPSSKLEIDSNIQMAIERGFIETSEPMFEAAQSKVEQELRESVVEKCDSDAKFVDWEQLSEKYSKYFQNDPVEYLSPDLRQFCFYEEHYHSRSDIVLKFNSLGPTAQTTQRNLIFNNGLTVDGNLDAGHITTELPLFVFVNGDLRVHNLLLSGWAEVVVTGNVVVSGAVVGYDGESGGRLKVLGDISAENYLGGFMYDLNFEGQVRGNVYWLDQDEPSIQGARIVPTELPQGTKQNLSAETPLELDAYTANSSWGTGEEVISYDLDVEELFDQIRHGRRIFR